MGADFKCIKTGTELGIPYGAFLNIRRTLSSLYNAEFGTLYKEWVSSLLTYNDKREETIEKNSKALDDLIEKLTKENPVSEDTIEFFFKPDCEGEISPAVCRELYDCIIKAKEKNEELTSSEAFSAFADLLRECSENESEIEWY